MKDEEVTDQILHCLAISIRSEARIEAVTKIVGLILARMQLSPAEVQSMSDLAMESALDAVEKSIDGLSKASPELGVKMRKILDGMTGDDLGFHFGNGRPH